MNRYRGNSLSLGHPLADGSVRMTASERARHLYVVGATRTGKSKLLEDCVRQDVLAWPKTGCGLLVLDRHGSLYDSLVDWAAAHDFSSWPIVPIDLRRGDWVVSYNPLRRRDGGEDAAVVVGNFVRSILHAWGQSDLSETPRLVKWLEAILLLLHEQGFTLAEALQLISDPAVRRAMTSRVQDLVLKSVWETAPAREAQFQEVVESTVNRVRRFLSRRVMRATLGQSDVSLDLGQALAEGQILLVSIATEGGKIDEEDASTLGSLLLSDLWMAAKARGKRDEGGVKPFYVYLDEFQEYVTPAMAQTLDQASGFGLHMTLAHQFPSQLQRGEQGKQLYHSVMANCRSKVVFQLEHNQDVEDLALMLFRQSVDVKKVKHEQYSTKVLGHQLQYLPSYSNGTTTGVGGGTSTSHTEGTNHSEGTNWGHTDTESEGYSVTDGTSESESFGVSESEGWSDGGSASLSLSDSRSDGESDTNGENWGEGENQSTTLSRSDGLNWSRSRGRTEGGSSGRSASRSRTETVGRLSERLQGELEEYEGGELDEEEETDFRRRRVESLALTDGESESEGESWGTSESDVSGGSRSLARADTAGLSRSHGESLAHSRSASRSRDRSLSVGTNSAVSRGLSRSRGVQTGTSHSESTSRGTSTSDSYGGSEAFGTSSADTTGENQSWSRGQTHGVSLSPLLMPILGRELSGVTFETIQEQLFRFAQHLSGQPDRHCVVKVVGRPPLSAVTLTVKPALTTGEWSLEWVTGAVQALSFSRRMDDALACIAARHRDLAAMLYAAPPADEPVTARRRIDTGGNGSNGNGRHGGGS